MIKTGERTIDAQIARLYAMGQEHIFAFWDELGKTERATLVDEIMEIDIDLMQRLIAEHGQAEGAAPAEVTIGPCTITDREDDPRRGAALQAGEEALRQGRVAAFLVAGGQGTRLGYDGPKGCFEVGPVSRRCLFQIHAEKIRAAAARYGVTIPWYIMTSRLNHESTVAFFREHGYFGLNGDDVFFFSQAMIPAVDLKGHFLLASPSTLFRSPNGHGGSLQALHASGALADMARRGIDLISYFQVDNCTVRVIDPVFIGFHVLDKAEMSSKVVDKRDPDEKVGVIGYVDGRLSVIEYSDMPASLTHEKLPDGSLKYAAGSIAIHILSRDFVRRQNEGGFRLPYHRALKKVPYIDGTGREIKPDKPNGIKFETFVFDALGDTAASVTLRTRREDEFSPVKNKDGLDSPATARQDMDAMYKRWLRSAGVTGDLPGTVELSPLFADTPGALQERLGGGFLYK